MPGYRTHFIISILIYVILLFLFIVVTTIKVVPYMEWFLCVLLGGFFPDIDTKSKGRFIFTSLALCTVPFLLYLQLSLLLVLLLCILIMSRIARHRGFFHSWSCLLLIGIGIIGLANFTQANGMIMFYDYLFFAAGFAGHIFLDRPFYLRRMF